MKKFSNLYIFSFSSIMVIAVAAVLAITALLLQPIQERNIAIEKKRNILSSIHVETSASDADAKFEQYIIETFVINHKGEVLQGVEAFQVSMRDELRKPLEQRKLPLYIGEKGDGRKYIFPLHGKGLWGPIYGYVALEDDMNSIYGANFGHDKETPGLGAEINQPFFQEAFVGKKIFESNGTFSSIRVVRGGTDPGNEHAVDAISGGTITSKGLEDMLYDCLISYESFIKTGRNQL